MPTLAWTGPCQDRHGHGRGRRPILVNGGPHPHARACLLRLHLALPLPATTRRRRSNRAAAAACAMRYPTHRPNPVPPGPSRQRLLRRTDRSVAGIPRVRLLCQRSRDTPSTPPPRRARHLAAPLTAATPRDGYKKPPPAPLRTAPPLPLPSSTHTTVLSPGKHPLTGIDPSLAALASARFPLLSTSPADSFHPEAPQNTAATMPCSPG